jgi:hypothetical protein
LQDGFQAKRVIKDWIGFYNSERPHTALDKRSPDDAFFDLELKWSGKTGQRAKMYPTRTIGYRNDQETQFFRQV